MSRKNGGIIGPANTPVGGLITGVAGGVWRMNDVTNFVSNNQWPKGPENIENSCRFNSGSSDRLIRTQTAGDRRTYTISWWMKRSGLSATTSIIGSDPDGSHSANFSILDFKNSDELDFSENVSGSSTWRLITNRKLRDVSGWYHIVFAVDTTQGTSSNRLKLYINGVQETSFSTENYPSQNLETKFNENSNKITVGGRSGQYVNGHFAEVIMIDGQQLDPTSFGETDSTTGIWKPKKIGQIANAGTNSFYLNFKDSSNLGNDESGLSNDFTVDNLTSIDQSTDTCVENFATLNALALNNNTSQNHGAFSEGNLKFVGNSASNNANAYSTIGVRQGKWYAEFNVTVGSNHYPNIGIVPYRTTVLIVGSGQVGADSNSFAYKSTGQKASNGDSSYGDSFATNDIIGVAMDLDNGAVYFSKNGTFQASGDPTSGSSKTNAAFGFTPLDEEYFFAAAVYESSTGVETNFGSPSYSISSGNSDANGHGNFEYSVPSGYYALNISNLNTYG